MNAKATARRTAASRQSVKARHGVASVVARSHGNNPLIAPFITVFTVVLAFFAGYV
ncbi:MULTISPECIES: hypothetical protein [Pseudomonas]|uniref:hypothetical protein n=1 Tax=Pseudomonas TaxID=286 RepID=UPI0015E486B2|nr:MULTISPECIES: hypothetical protein [Pseudomonas]WLG51415.1 hypothetical protein PSH64_02565 [Pseudomonas sp. FP1742]